MKQITTLILLLWCGTSPKTNEFIGEWVAVYNWSGSEEGIGLIFNFKDDKKITISSIGSTKEIDVDYQLDRVENKLLINGRGTYETFGYFKKVSSDKFVIMTPDSSQNMEFRRIRETNLKFNKEQLLSILKNSSWVSKNESDSVRIDFRESHRWDNEKQPYEAMFHYWIDEPNKEIETWNVGEYKGKLFLRYTNYQSIFTVHQINEFTQNSITWTESYDLDVGTGLIRKRELTDISMEQLWNSLCDKVWKSIKVDTLKSSEEGEISATRDNDVLTFDNLKQTLEFKFNRDKTYLATLSGQEWKKGSWDVTKDGEYIIIDREQNKDNWIQVNHKTRNWTLTKLHKIKGGQLGYKLYQLTITLQ